MRRAIFVCLCLFGLLSAYEGRAAVVMDQPEPVMMVDKLHTALLDNMKAGNTQNFEARRKHLEPVVHEVFDLQNMTRVSVGPAWQKLSDDDKMKLVDAFGKWTIATYASQFKAHDGEAFVVKNQPDPAKGDVVVNTEIKVKDGDPVVLNYRVRQVPAEKGVDKADGPWQVIDIYLDGAISQLALRRSDFAAVLKKGGAASLIEHLNQMTAKLAAGG